MSDYREAYRRALHAEGLEMAGLLLRLDAALLETFTSEPTWPAAQVAYALRLAADRLETWHRQLYGAPVADLTQQAAGLGAGAAATEPGP